LHNSGASCREMAKLYFAVIASEAKQSIEQKSKNGLLRRFAPRNDGFDDAIDNSLNNRADIRHPERYINPARHVRAFGVRMGIKR
jgi:hypothetical protein